MWTYQEHRDTLRHWRREKWNVTESGYIGNGQDWFQQLGSAPNCRHRYLATTGIMVSCAEECIDERELARAVVRAEAILVASHSLFATFCLCFFLYFSVGSHSCGCSASTVSFRVECAEGSAMTGTQRHFWPVWCCSVLETLAETAVRRGTTCSELFVVRCGVDMVFEAWWRRRDRTCGGDGGPVQGGRASRVSWSSETESLT